MRGRISKLDSVRGLAALSVVAYHCGLSLPDGMQTDVLDRLHLFWPSFVLLDGNDAVRVFFLLSGYVLALSFLKDAPPTYGRFVVRRVCRIYIPFVAVLALTVVGYMLMPLAWGQPVGTWLSSTFQRPDLDDVLGALFMARIDNPANPPIWSLVVEMRVSLLFPLLMLLVRRYGAYPTLLGSLILWAVSQRLTRVHLGFPLEEIRGTSFQLLLFVSGIVLAQKRVAIAAWLDTLGVLRLSALWLAGLALVEYRFVPYALPFQPIVPLFGTILLFPLLVHSSRLERPLSASPIRFLGRVSYSLYLCHFPILVVLTHLPAQWLPAWSAVALVIPVSIGVATVLYVTVEAPAARLGHLLGTDHRKQAAADAAAMAAMEPRLRRA